MSSCNMHACGRLACVAVLAVAVCACLAGQSSTPQEEKNKELVLAWYREVVISGHVELASRYMAADYIEHDPNVPGGNKAGFVQYYGRTPAGSIRAALPKQPFLAFGKGDRVVLVWEHDDTNASGKPIQYNTYDVVRIQNGKIQEHWDGDVKHD